MSALQLERAVWQTISDLLTSPSTVKELIESRRQEFERGGAGAELDRVRSVIESTQRERGRRLGQHAKGYITDAELDLALRGVTERIERYSEELKRLEREAWTHYRDIRSMDDFLSVANHIKARLPEMNDEERAEVNRLLIDSIVIEPSDVRIVLLLDGATKASATRC